MDFSDLDMDMKICERCVYSSATMVGDDTVSCHRFPPATIVADESIGYGFPIVGKYGWCGEWRERIISAAEKEIIEAYAEQ